MKKTAESTTELLPLGFWDFQDFRDFRDFRGFRDFEISGIFEISRFWPSPRQEISTRGLGTMGATSQGDDKTGMRWAKKKACRVQDPLAWAGAQLLRQARSSRRLRGGDGGGGVEGRREGRGKERRDWGWISWCERAGGGGDAARSLVLTNGVWAAGRPSAKTDQCSARTTPPRSALTSALTPPHPHAWHHDA